MRILLITDRYPVYPGRSPSGWMRSHVQALSRVAELDVVSIVRAMPRVKTLLVRDHAGRRFSPQRLPRSLQREEGYTVYYLPLGTVPDSLSWSANPWLLRRRHGAVLREIAAERSPDIILVHFAHPSSLAALSLGKELGVPVVIAANESLDVYARTGKMRAVRWIRTQLHEADAVIVQCEAQQQAVLRHTQPRHILKLPLGVQDSGRQLEVVKDLSPFRFVFVGRLDDELKRVDAAIEGLARARRESGLDLRLTVAGEGIGRRRLESFARRHLPAETVSFPGWVSEQQLPAFLRGYHAFLFPSEVESFGMVYLEAAEAALPMIVRGDTGIVGELLSCNQGILPLENSSAESVAAAAIRMYREYETLRAHAMEARSRILEDYSWERHAERYQEALRQLQK